jgi:hypothetical protein
MSIGGNIQNRIVYIIKKDTSDVDSWEHTEKIVLYFLLIN